MFISSKPDDPAVTNFISPSQLEIRHGGIAPNVTHFWPPIMPEYTDFDENNLDKNIKIVSREKYNEFYTKNKRGLHLMPRRLRMDLPPLPEDIVDQPPH